MNKVSQLWLSISCKFSFVWPFSVSSHLMFNVSQGNVLLQLISVAHAGNFAKIYKKEVLLFYLYYLSYELSFVLINLCLGKRVCIMQT